MIATGAGLLRIAQVGPEALDSIMTLLREASDWLLSRGIRQWRRMYTEDGRAYVAARFATGDVYLVYRDDVPVATFTLCWEDTFWGEAGTDGLAGYLHGFAVSRQVGGLGVGRDLMAWMSAHFAAHGRHCFRLNTAEENPGIRGYYEDLGFTPCGVLPHPLGGMTRLYEREITA